MEQSTLSLMVLQALTLDGVPPVWHCTQAMREWREPANSAALTYSDAAARCPLERRIGVAAQAIAVGHPLGVENLADFVRLVAVDARRDQVRLLLPQLAADHLAVHGLDLRVAPRAGLGDVLFGDGGAGIGVGKHVVRGVATGADRGNRQALLEQADAMNAVLVILEDVGLRNGARLADFGAFAVTAAAEARNVDGGDRRLQVGRGQDVVRAVAELAAGSIGVVLGRLLAVDAAGILALLFAVAQAAIDAGQLFRMRNFFDVAVAGDAIQGGMGGRFQGGRVEAGGTPGWRFPMRGPESWQPAQSSARGCAACWPGRPAVSRVAMAASRSRFTAVMVWYFSTNQPIRSQ